MQLVGYMPNTTLLLKAYELMLCTKYMAALYETKKKECRYVHSTSLGHQAVQIATAFQLQPRDWVSPYYRDECLLLGMGFSPKELMLQLLAKADDPFSGGRSYYGHPSSRQTDKPKIMHQSSATGMQAIPATGLAEGLQFMRLIGKMDGNPAVVICSLGDASVTEGEVSEAWQVAVLKKLPIIYLVQDNGWGISVASSEARAMNAAQYAKGFPGMKVVQLDGTDFEASYASLKEVVDDVRAGNGPWLVHALVPLLGHHTSGVRKEFYRNEQELITEAAKDPIAKLEKRLLSFGVLPEELSNLQEKVAVEINLAFDSAIAAPPPEAHTVESHVFAPTTFTVEVGDRSPKDAPIIPMVDAALFAISEIMEDYPEALLYGQDVGRRLGGVFREAATLAEKFGDHRVFNTAIHEAYIIGSTAGMSATGAKPIVEIQFADYIYPGINQLVTELSKSCYLSMGKFPIQAVIRIPTGAYGGGGPYHSGSIETTLLSIKGIKVVYPSNAADMKGLMKAAFLDPNPVVILEHKGLYWSKVPGTENAKRPQPDRNYILPLGKANLVVVADDKKVEQGESCCIITYGMGVHWAMLAAQQFVGCITIIDLRTLFPLDEALIFETVKLHGKALVLTEEQQNNSFAEALAGRIQYKCFTWLDAPVEVLGALSLPAVPIHVDLEQAMLPNAAKVAERIQQLLLY